MRVYTVPLVALAVTNDADQDIFEIVMGAGVVGHLLSYMLESALTTDERLNWRLLRRTTTGSGGTGCTEVPVDAGDAAGESGNGGKGVQTVCGDTDSEQDRECFRQARQKLAFKAEPCGGECRLPGQRQHGDVRVMIERVIGAQAPVLPLPGFSRIEAVEN